jgi:hypothetical protein
MVCARQQQQKQQQQKQNLKPRTTRGARGITSTLKRAYANLKSRISATQRASARRKAAQQFQADIPALKQKMRADDAWILAHRESIAKRLPSNSPLNERVVNDYATRKIMPEKIKEFEAFNQNRVKLEEARKQAEFKREVARKFAEEQIRLGNKPTTSSMVRAAGIRRQMKIIPSNIYSKCNFVNFIFKNFLIFVLFFSCQEI